MTKFSNRQEINFSTKLDLGALYKSNVERTEFIIDFYKNIYDLPLIIDEFNVTKELFEYCNKRQFFLNLLAFQDNKVFLKRSIGSELRWELPGGSIRSKGNETIQDAAARILERDIPGIDVSELMPVVYSEKHYKFNGHIVIHKGLTIMGRVRHPSPKEILKNEEIKGRFVRIEDQSEIDRLIEYEKNLLEIGKNKITIVDSFQQDSIDNEIDSTDSISKFTMFLHNNIIRPIGQTFSSKIIKSNMLSYLKEDITVLDVACGDDSFIFEIAKRSALCIGNDVAWNQIKSIVSKTPLDLQNLIFTNHDARHLPFEFKFDLTICKNLVHHMQSRKDLEDLFCAMKNVSKSILIVDPDDPQKSSIRARVWNWYYRIFLHDQGERFMNKKLLKRAIDEYFGEVDIEYKSIKTIKGDYLFCSINLETKISTENETSTIKEKAIIFDFDGVIADSEPLFLKSHVLNLKKNDIHITQDDYIQSDLQNGISLLDRLYMNGIIKSNEDLIKITNDIYATYKELIDKEIKLMPYVEDTIKTLGKNYKLAIASSSKLEFIEQILVKFNLEKYFDVVIARESVNNLKPSPDCFIEAMNQLNLKKDNCIIIEDSMRGVKAALSSNIKVIVIPNELTNNGNYGGEIVLNTISELNKTLNEINFKS